MKRLVFGVLIMNFLSGHAWCEEYHWPMDTEPALTSTFGEYRAGRLHAAIDLKTWGKEGYPVLAVADGYVVRVRTSPWGYGRAVYLHLNDGRFAVSAHLSGFSDGIEKYVQEEQHRRGTYSVNLYFRADQLPVKRGDVVGFSGSTGIGVPHLHFELRDADHRPINPLTKGFDIADTIPPTVTGVGLVPLTAQSRVNGKAEPQVFGVGGVPKNGQADTVTIWGQIGVGVGVYDRADASASTNKLAPYRLRMTVDEKETFATGLDAFGYAVTQHGELDRNFMMSQRAMGRFHNLFRMAGNYLPFYGAYRIGDGILHAGGKSSRTGRVLSRGLHRLKIMAEDVKGNISEARLVVRVAELPQVRMFEAQWLDQAVTVTASMHQVQRARFAFSKDAGQTWQPLGKWLSVSGEFKRTLKRVPGAVFRLEIRDAFDHEAFVTFAPSIDEPPNVVCRIDYFPNYAILKLKADRPLSQPPTGRLRFGNRRQNGLYVKQTDLMTYEAVVAFDSRRRADLVIEIRTDATTITEGVSQHVVTKRQGGSIVSSDGMASVRFESNGVYETLFGRVVPEPSMVDDRMVGTAYRFMPYDVAFEKAEVILRYPEGVTDTSKVGLYTWDLKKGWVFADIGRDSGIYGVNGEVKHLGIFALLVDDVAPEVSGFSPESGEAVLARQPTLQATIRDVSSGIWREEDIEMRIDGKRLVVEYDPEEDLIFAKPRKPLAVGVHQIEVIVKDICGNVAQTLHSFDIK
jgi:hypothetical protein